MLPQREPYGYRRSKGESVLVEPKQAEMILEAFELRAAGEPFSVIGRRFGWSHSTTRQRLMNAAYVGVDGLLPAIVSRELFEQANAARTRQPISPGDTTRDRLLRGLVRCGGCGHTLKVVRRARADGSHVASYYCKDAAGEPCRDRAFVHADDLDQFVTSWFEEQLRWTPRLVDVVAAARDLEDAQAGRERAEADLVGYVEAASALEPALFRRGLDARQARVDEARERVRELSARVTRLPSGGSLVELWAGFDVAERREVLHGFLDRIVVTRGAAHALDDNLRIYWTDGTLAGVVEDEQRLRVAAA